MPKPQGLSLLRIPFRHRGLGIKVGLEPTSPSFWEGALVHVELPEP